MKLNNLKDIKANLEEIAKSVAYCCEAVPSCCEEEEEVSKWEFEDLKYTVNFLQRQIDSLNEALYRHSEGHLPAILDVGKLQKAIDVLGLSDSFEVRKKVIYSSEGQVKECVVSFASKTKE